MNPPLSPALAPWLRLLPLAALLVLFPLVHPTPAAAAAPAAATPSSQAQGSAPRPEKTNLSVADGQMISRLFEVRLDRILPQDANPRLTLIPASSRQFARAARASQPTEDADGRDRDGERGTPAVAVSPGVAYLDTFTSPAGIPTPVPVTGTLMLFPVIDFKIPFYQPVMGVWPLLEWTENGVPRSALARREVYVGNPATAILGSGTVVLLFTLLILAWSHSRTGDAHPGGSRASRALAAICNPDGSLSLWRTQLAAWTLATGWMVLLFGTLKLAIPEIPVSLVALMGMSLATGGLSAWKQPSSEPDAAPGAPKPPTAPAAPVSVPATGAASDAARLAEFAPSQNPADRLPTRISDLLSAFNPKSGRVEISIAKSQMVVWTLLGLTLFVGKSLIDGVLWPVPWELVALMGMSQAGYVVPKYANGNG